MKHGAVKRGGLSQEGLKTIACITMLIDHIGAVFTPGYYTYYILRILGRTAFPIYCFLLAEGAYYTRNPGKYALRLGLGMLLSELPFDYALFGGWTWAHQNVMLTLLLGLGALEAGKRLPAWGRLLVLVPFALAAEWLKADYGAWGVVMISAFSMARQLPHAKCTMAGLLVAITLMMDSAHVPFLWGMPIELFALLAMIPIACYSGKKASPAKPVQVGFYFFYPVHLAVIWMLHAV